MSESLACPVCGRPVALAAERQPASFPFCCARCRTIDFGAWTEGRYAIAGQSADDAASGSTEDDNAG